MFPWSYSLIDRSELHAGHFGSCTGCVIHEGNRFLKVVSNNSSEDHVFFLFFQVQLIHSTLIDTFLNKVSLFWMTERQTEHIWKGNEDGSLSESAACFLCIVSTMVNNQTPHVGLHLWRHSLRKLHESGQILGERRSACEDSAAGRCVNPILVHKVLP